MVLLNKNQTKISIFVCSFILFGFNANAMFCDRSDFICEDFPNGTIRCQPPSGNFTCNIENHDWDGKGAALVSSIGVATAIDCLQGRNGIIWKFASVTCHGFKRFKPYIYVINSCNNRFFNNKKSVFFDIKNCCNGCWNDCDDRCNSCKDYLFEEEHSVSHQETPKEITISEKTLTNIEKMLEDYGKKTDKQQNKLRQRKGKDKGKEKEVLPAPVQRTTSILTPALLQSYNDSVPTITMSTAAATTTTTTTTNVVPASEIQEYKTINDNDMSNKLRQKKQKNKNKGEEKEAPLAPVQRTPSMLIPDLPQTQNDSGPTITTSTATTTTTTTTTTNVMSSVDVTQKDTPSADSHTKID